MVDSHHNRSFRFRKFSGRGPAAAAAAAATTTECRCNGVGAVTLHSVNERPSTQWVGAVTLGSIAKMLRRDGWSGQLGAVPLSLLLILILTGLVVLVVLVVIVVCTAPNADAIGRWTALGAVRTTRMRTMTMMTTRMRRRRMTTRRSSRSASPSRSGCRPSAARIVGSLFIVGSIGGRPGDTTG